MQANKISGYQELLLALGVKPLCFPNPTKNNAVPPLMQASLLDAGKPDPKRICKDGERTHHLIRLAGSWIGQGKDIDDVKLMALGWNASNAPPLDQAKVLSTCESILKTHQSNHPGAIDSGPITPLFDLSEARGHDMVRNTPPPRRWLLQDCLPYGKVGMIIAPGGTGKSMFALQLAVSLAVGNKFAGQWGIGEIGASLLLFGEEDTEEIHRRLHNIVSATLPYTPTAAKDIEEMVYVKSMTGIDNLMTRNLPTGGVVLTDYADRLVMTAGLIPDLKLIIIDPASRFRGGNENAAEDTTRFVEALERVCQQTGATVLVLHHANKGSQSADEASQHASRGSSAMTDGVRWQMNLGRPTPGEAKKRGICPEGRHNYLVASVTKNNYGPPQPDVVLIRGDHGILAASTVHMSVAASEQILVDILRSERAAGHRYSATAFEEKFGGESGPFKIGIHALRKLISGAIGQGLIRKQRGKLEVIDQVAP